MTHPRSYRQILIDAARVVGAFLTISSHGQSTAAFPDRTRLRHRRYLQVLTLGA